MNAQHAPSTSTSNRTRLVLLTAVVVALVLSVLMSVVSLGAPADAAGERSAIDASATSSALMAGGSATGSVGNN